MFSDEMVLFLAVRVYFRVPARVNNNNIIETVLTFPFLGLIFDSLQCPVYPQGYLFKQWHGIDPVPF